MRHSFMSQESGSVIVNPLCMIPVRKTFPRQCSKYPQSGFENMLGNGYVEIWYKKEAGVAFWKPPLLIEPKSVFQLQSFLIHCA